MSTEVPIIKECTWAEALDRYEAYLQAVQFQHPDHKSRLQALLSSRPSDGNPLETA